VPLERTLAALVELREASRIRQLGVSNFPAGMLEQALGPAPVFCDQVDYHPLLGQERLLRLARERSVLVTPTPRSPTAGCRATRR
jgi:2,5-diketo-D-gluconate reductase B